MAGWRTQPETMPARKSACTVGSETGKPRMVCVGMTCRNGKLSGLVIVSRGWISGRNQLKLVVQSPA